MKVWGVLCWGVAGVLSVVRSGQAAPGGSLAQMTGCASCVKLDKQQWSPLQGALAHQTSLLKSLYASEVQANHEPSATAHVLKELFFVGDNEQLAVATAPNRFGSRAQVSDIALIAHLIEAEKVERVLNAKKLKDFISAKKIKSLEDLSDRLSRGTPQKNLTDLIAAIAPKTVQELQAALDAYEKMLGDGDMRKKRMALLGQIQGALCESSGVRSRYAPYTPHTILMGFLVSSAAQRGKQTALDYRATIADYFDGMRDLGTPITTEGYSRELFLREPLYAESQETIDKLVGQLKKQYAHDVSFKDFLQNNYENLALLGVLQRRYQLVHPLPEYAHVTLSFGQKCITFGDCVEASVLGFLNELWFNPHERTLAIPGGSADASGQPSGQNVPVFFTLPPEIQQFYARFCPQLKADPANFYTDEVHGAWADLFARRADLPIAYNTQKHAEPCEVNASPANTVTMLAHALGMPQPAQPLTLASLLTFFIGVTQRVNARYDAQLCDKKIVLHTVAVRKVCPAGTAQTQVISLEDGARQAQSLAAIPELHDVLHPTAQKGEPYYSSIALTFLVRTADREQQFSWYIEPKHSWFQVRPLERVQNTVRAQIMEQLPGFEQNLLQAVDEYDPRVTSLTGLYCNHQELETLASVLSPASLNSFCWAQSVYELMATLEQIKNNRALPNADSVACAIAKVALASEDLEAFIGECIAVLTAPTWSPALSENTDFWKKLIQETFPAKHMAYNKAVIEQVLQCDEAAPGGSVLLGQLCDTIKRSGDEGLRVLLDDEARKYQKEQFVQQKLASTQG